MADQIVVMNGGRIEQVGSPMDLYHRPASEFVAGFIGSPAMNLFAANSALAAGLDTHPTTPTTRTIGIRPEHVAIGPPGSGNLDLHVAVKEQLGGESYLYLRNDGGDRLVVKTDGEDPTAAGNTIAVTLPANRLHRFGPDGQSVAGPVG